MTLFLIPARAGSKRLPGKNKRLFCGLPLWMWSVATAERYGGPIHVSTDDIEIMTEWHCQARPKHLCADDSPTSDLVAWVFDVFPEHDTICLLQPTSPTRSDSLVRKLIAHGGQVRSVTDGKPNGQCYVYRRGHEGWIDIETEKGHDIDVEADFIAAEKYMLEKFR